MFIQSVRNNGGYYIARYEAGVTGYDETNIETSNESKDPNWTGYKAKEGESLELVTKKGVQPWNYVTQSRASDLCQNLFSEIKSDLVNSYAWDTAILFIQKNQTDEEKPYSRQIGVASNLNLSLTGESILYDTGELDKRCNIYDMAGNYTEWSTETRELGEKVGEKTVNRGGHFFTDVYYTSSRETEGGEMLTAFRPILYF